MAVQAKTPIDEVLELVRSQAFKRAFKKVIGWSNSRDRNHLHSFRKVDAYWGVFSKQIEFGFPHCRFKRWKRDDFNRDPQGFVDELISDLEFLKEKSSALDTKTLLHYLKTDECRSKICRAAILRDRTASLWFDVTTDGLVETELGTYSKWPKVHLAINLGGPYTYQIEFVHATPGYWYREYHFLTISDGILQINRKNVNLIIDKLGDDLI